MSVQIKSGLDFRCKDNCGACCQSLKEKAKNLRVWVWLRLLDRGDGTCKHLTENKKCSIYFKRPEVCVIKRYKYTKEEIESACDILIEKVKNS